MKNIILEAKNTYKLVNRLEKAGYQGIDVSIEESLFEYGMVAKKFKDHYFILYCYNFDENDVRYDYTRVDLNDIKEDLEEIEQGFYDWLGTKKKEYIKTTDGISKIFDINQYNGTYSESGTFGYSIEDVLRWNLESDGD